MTTATTTTRPASRRSFLAGTGALTVTASLGSPVLAQSTDLEPIFAAIDAHRTVTAAVLSALKTHGALERDLPRDKRKSVVDAFEETIVPTDDPRWINNQREIAAAWDAQEDAACVLVSIMPTTRAGLLALLQYAIVADDDGQMWPDLLNDGNRQRSWHQLLIANLVEILPGMIPQS